MRYFTSILVLLTLLTVIISSCKEKQKKISSTDAKGSLVASSSITTIDEKQKKQVLIPAYFYQLTHLYDKKNNGYISIQDIYAGPIGKQKIHFEGNYIKQEFRDSLLNQLGVKETDTIFIFSAILDTVFKFKISETPIVAREAPYLEIEPEFPIHYDLGFSPKINLSKIPNVYNSTYTCIAKENIFQTGRIQRVLWTKIDSSIFPAQNDSVNNHSWFNTLEKGEAYKFTGENYTFFIQNLLQADQVQARHLLVVEKKTKSVTLNYVYYDSESTSLTPLSTTSSALNNHFQWIGDFIQNKPSVIFGFTTHSFGCPSIKFVDSKYADIPIMCDNQH